MQRKPGIKCFIYSPVSGFATGVEKMGEGGGALQNLMMGGGGLKSIHGGSLKCCQKMHVKEFI